MTDLWKDDPRIQEEIEKEIQRYNSVNLIESFIGVSVLISFLIICGIIVLIMVAL